MKQSALRSLRPLLHPTEFLAPIFFLPFMRKMLRRNRSAKEDEEKIEEETFPIKLN